MSMERWNPFWELDSMRNRLDRMFEERFPNLFDSGQQSQFMNLAIDVREVDGGFEIEASLPGFKADDIDIEINRDIVTLRGKQESSTEKRSEGKNYLYRERRAGSFYRTVRLPGLLNGARAEAHLEHGVLRVHIPRLQETTGHRLKISPAQDKKSTFSNTSSTTGDNAQPGTVGSSGSALGMSGHSDSPGGEAATSASINSNNTTTQTSANSQYHNSGQSTEPPPVANNI